MVNWNLSKPLNLGYLQDLNSTILYASIFNSVINKKYSLQSVFIAQQSYINRQFSSENILFIYSSNKQVIFYLCGSLLPWSSHGVFRIWTISIRCCCHPDRTENGNGARCWNLGFHTIQAYTTLIHSHQRQVLGRDVQSTFVFIFDAYLYIMIEVGAVVPAPTTYLLVSL